MNRVLVVVCLALAGCVSSRLAESNLEAVSALAEVAVQTDPQTEPVAHRAVGTAEEIVEASGTLRQIASLGVPEELVEENVRNVETLSDIVAPPGVEPPAEIRLTVEDAKATSRELAGRSESQKKTLEATQSTPLAPWVSIVSAVAAALLARSGWQKYKDRKKTKPPVA